MHKQKVRVLVTIGPATLFYLATIGLNIWISNGATFFYSSYAKTFLAKSLSLTQVIALSWVIGTILYYYISYLHKQVELKDDQLKQNANELYKHFSELNNFKKKEVLLELTKKFTNMNQFLLGTQLYQYNCKMQKDCIIKVNFDSGYVIESASLNAIMQEYFVIPKTLYRDFRKVMEEFNQFQIKNTLKFVQKYHAELTGKTSVNESDAVKYALLRLSIESKFSSDPKSINNLLPTEVENQLLNMKRLGILNGILKKNSYIFNHDGNNHKNGRIYITRCITLDKNDYVLLLTVSPDIVEERDYKIVFEHLIDTFIRELQNHFQVSYNINDGYGGVDNAQSAK